MEFLKSLTAKKIFSFTWQVALFSLCSWAIANFCIKETRGFTIEGISSHRPFHPEWKCRSLTQDEQVEWEKASSQKYTFYSSGGQCFVFLSEDGQYVIKFFLQRLYYLPLWLKYFPIPLVIDRYIGKIRDKRADKLVRDFASYKAAFEELSDIGGVLFVHLNQTDHIKKTLTIVDRLEIEHHLPLDRFDFVVQRKADLVYDWIHSLMRNGKEPEAKEAISSILNLIVGRCKKGFRDRDPQIEANCGFINGKAMKIDVGRFVKEEKMKEPEVYKSELLRISLPFKEWLEKTYPSLTAHYEEEMANILN